MYKGQIMNNIAFKPIADLTDYYDKHGCVL